MMPYDNFWRRKAEYRIISVHPGSRPAICFAPRLPMTMTNSEKLNDAFAQALQIDPTQVTDSLAMSTLAKARDILGKYDVAF